MTTALVRVCLCRVEFDESQVDGDADGLPDAADPFVADPLNLIDLREAGSDGVFDTADDSVYLAVLRSPYSSGTTLDFEILDGPLGADEYRFTMTATIADVRGNALDGEQRRRGWGRLGADLQHRSTVRSLRRPGNRARAAAVPLALVEDPAGSGLFHTDIFGIGSLDSGRQ